MDPYNVPKNIGQMKATAEKIAHDTKRGVLDVTEKVETTVEQVPGVQTTKAAIYRSAEIARSMISSALSILTVYLKRYPALAGFLTVWSFFSLIPAGIFLLVTMGSLLATSAIATTIVFTINAGVFAVSSFVLGITLFFTFMGASIAYFWLVVIGVARAAASRLFYGVQSSTRSIASTIDEGHFTGVGK